MVARIRTGRSLKGAVNYNEQKVREGKADLILARGYTKKEARLNIRDKINRLQRLADLNTRTRTHCLHVSLNFDPAERLPKEKLQEIAERYMDKIGFGSQPFLVYQHHDAAHQHVHIVTTNIQRDGKRISLHNLGKVQSEAARKEIELTFDLVKASDRQKSQIPSLKPSNLEKATYGKSETKRAISNIVTAVVSQYKFASLPEFNAVLQQFNLFADRGAEQTRMYEKRGLQYSLLDDQGRKIGIPVKASSIHSRPTLAQLELKYESNKAARQPFRETLKNTLDQIIPPQVDRKSFADALRSRGVDVIFRTNEHNFIYGITYVDHNTKSVFNGSELGKLYSAAAIRELWKPDIQEPDGPLESKGGRHPKLTQSGPPKTAEPVARQLIEIVTDPTESYNYLPWELRKKRKRKQRKI